MWTIKIFTVEFNFKCLQKLKKMEYILTVILYVQIRDVYGNLLLSMPFEMFINLYNEYEPYIKETDKIIVIEV